MNGGGPKGPLCLLVKSWWTWCQEQKVRPSYRWIRRELNTEADELSKSAGKKWQLRKEVIVLLSAQWLSATVQLECPDFSRIGNVLKEAQRDRKKFVLVYPGWPGQSWWLEIQRYAKQTVVLGSASSVFEPLASWQRIGVGAPKWMFF